MPDIEVIATFVVFCHDCDWSYEAHSRYDADTEGTLHKCRGPNGGPHRHVTHHTDRGKS